MFLSKRILISVNMAGLLLCQSILGHASAISNSTIGVASPPSKLINETFNTNTNPNKTFFYFDFLYLQPSSNNLRYATFVSGTQPYYQSWHYQEIKPSYHPAFEVGLNYAIPRTLYSAAINWTHLNADDNDSKQASTNTDLSTVEFVAPPYEMSPPVFGIKSVRSNVNFDFNNVVLNVGRLVEFTPHTQARVFCGIDILSLNQTINTTFGDYAGSPPTPYSYPLPPDPSFSFKTQNISNYVGAGPALGLNFQYTLDSGFGFMGDLLGLITAGTMKAQDNFTSTSARLTELGIGTSHQRITSPDTTQIVLGADAKLGVFYHYQGVNLPNLTIALGYRIASFINAITTISPNTLVQPGTVETTPEFATGTMAIVSTNVKNSPFNYNGPFLSIKLAIA